MGRVGGTGEADCLGNSCWWFSSERPLSIIGGGGGHTPNHLGGIVSSEGKVWEQRYRSIWHLVWGVVVGGL